MRERRERREGTWRRDKEGGKGRGRERRREKEKKEGQRGRVQTATEGNRNVNSIKILFRRRFDGNNDYIFGMRRDFAIIIPN